jgi:RHS repeat-associated protein
VLLEPGVTTTGGVPYVSTLENFAITDISTSGNTIYFWRYGSSRGSISVTKTVLAPGIVTLNLATGAIPDLVVSHANGMGATTTLGYTSSSVWPLAVVPVGSVMPTVSSLTISDGRGAAGTTTTRTFAYEGASFLAADRRFLGYRKVTETDEEGNRRETFYHQHAGCTDKPESLFVRDAAGALYQYTQLGYLESASAPYTSVLENRWTGECNPTTGACRVVRVQYQHDSFGNVTVLTEHGDEAVLGDERTTVTGFFPNHTAYIVSAPAYENVYQGVGTATLAAQALFEYDGNTAYDQAPSIGNRARIRRWDDATGGHVVTSVDFDAAGNPIAETDALGNVTLRGYDDHHRLASVCDPLSTPAVPRCRTQVWDAALGVVTATQDENGGETIFDHDALGREIHVARADGSWVETSHLDMGTAIQRVRTVTSDGTPDGRWREAFQDGLGRVYWELREGPEADVTYARVTHFLDASDRVWQRSSWYDPATEIARLEVKAYDGARRLVTVTHPDGSYTENVYGDGWTIAYDELRHERTLWTDGLGRLSAVREKVGGVAHDTLVTHDALDRMVEVRDSAGNYTTFTWDSLGNRTSLCDPDSGCRSYEHDDAGRLVAWTDARGQQVAQDHDALGRITSRTYPDGDGRVRWIYDEAGRGPALGRLTTIVDLSGSLRLEYDDAGRIAAETRCITGACNTLARAYDAAGRLSSITYPSGEVVSHEFDAAGRLRRVASPLAVYADDLEYDARDALRSASYGNGVTATWTRHVERGWLSGREVRAGAVVLDETSYGYDVAGRITGTSSATRPLANGSFTSDELDRLLSVAGALSETFGYDAIGNLTFRSGIGNYQYGDPDHRHAVTAAGTNRYGYDANGNMTWGAGRSFVWDAEDRPESVTEGGATTTFRYDAQGTRTCKEGAGGVVRTFGPLIEQAGCAPTYYYYAGDVLLARRDAGGVAWAHLDHLGSPRLWTDGVGAVISSHDYDPFGATIGADPGERGFGGHVDDGEVGLIQMGARSYDPTLGRFVSADSLVSTVVDPQRLNRYAFAGNNPISHVDPDGHDYYDINFDWNVNLDPGGSFDFEVPQWTPSLDFQFDLGAPSLGSGPPVVFIGGTTPSGTLDAGSLTFLSSAGGNRPAEVDFTFDMINDIRDYMSDADLLRTPIDTLKTLKSFTDAFEGEERALRMLKGFEFVDRALKLGEAFGNTARGLEDGDPGMIGTGLGQFITLGLELGPLGRFNGAIRLFTGVNLLKEAGDGWGNAISLFLHPGMAPTFATPELWNPGTTEGGAVSGWTGGRGWGGRRGW